jgi:chromate transporter
VILLRLFLGFGRVGLLGFGGGPSMIPLMQAECVDSGWVTQEQFLEGLAAGNALPGPIATKMAMYVGYEEAGILGSIAAFLGVTAPSSVLMLALGALLIRYRDNRLVAGALQAVKPAVIGMLFFVAYDLGPSGVKGVGTALIAGAAFLALVMRVHPAIVMVAAVGIGVLAFRG